MSSFQIEISEKNLDSREIKIVTLAGYADATNVHEVNENVATLIQNCDSDVVLVGTKVEFINSTFIGYLTSWYSCLQEKEKKLVLAGFPPNVVDTLTVVGLLDLIPSFYTVDEAELSFVEKPTEEKKETILIV